MKSTRSTGAPSTRGAPMDQRRWEALTGGALTIAAVIFLAAFSVQILLEPTGAAAFAVILLQLVLWLVFLVDYIVRLTLARPRRQWFMRHLLDFASVALPILRPLRMLRVLTLLTFFHRRAGSSLRGRVVAYTVGTTLLLVYVCALAMLGEERYAPDSHITTFGTAIWWACVTITTVGYGDTYPVTAGGRLIAIVLMTGGIALLGTITATIASFLVESVSEKDEENQVATRRQVAELTDRIEALTRQLARAADPAAPRPDAP